MTLKFTRLTVLTSAAWIALASAASAQWCSFYDPYTYTCGFRTLDMCRQNISGMGGICSPDVRYPSEHAQSRETTGGPRIENHPQLRRQRRLDERR